MPVSPWALPQPEISLLPSLRLLVRFLNRRRSREGAGEPRHDRTLYFRRLSPDNHPKDPIVLIQNCRLTECSLPSSMLQPRPPCLLQKVPVALKRDLARAFLDLHCGLSRWRTPGGVDAAVQYADAGPHASLMPLPRPLAPAARLFSLPHLPGSSREIEALAACSFPPFCRPEAGCSH